MTYTIKFASGGREETYPTYEAAKDAVLKIWPEAEIGHSGDLDDGGNVTRCWRNEQESIDDSGYAAVASIYRD